MKDYDTLCLFSGDSDFARLAHFIKKRGKKIIVIASGQIYHEINDLAAEPRGRLLLSDLYSFTSEEFKKSAHYFSLIIATA